MKRLLKNILIVGAFIFMVASPVATIVAPQATYASSPGNCEAYLLGVIPPWYRGLTNTDCSIKSPSDFKSSSDPSGISTFVWKIVLNAIQMALVLASLIAVFFILYGGFLFLTGGNNASQIEKGQKSILNAVIGLVISMGAIAITNLIFGLLNGATTNNAYGVPEIQASDLLHSALNMAYYIAGIIAVIVIIVAGINYVTSQGDSGKVTKAKNMVLYAVIGLGVLLAAFAITNFVVMRFK